VGFAFELQFCIVPACLDTGHLFCPAGPYVMDCRLNRRLPDWWIPWGPSIPSSHFSAATDLIQFPFRVFSLLPDKAPGAGEYPSGMVNCLILLGNFGRDLSFSFTPCFFSLDKRPNLKKASCLVFGRVPPLSPFFWETVVPFHRYCTFRLWVNVPPPAAPSAWG